MLTTDDVKEELFNNKFIINFILNYSIKLGIIYKYVINYISIIDSD